jgi:two-component system response regulator FixJ
MPDMDGFEVQTRLLQLGVLLPVIVMTGKGDVPGAVQAMEAGAVDFIEKSYGDDALLGAVKTALWRATRADHDHEVEEAARRGGALSPREREVRIP